MDKKKILVVDDDDSIRELIYELLKDEYSIEMASDGRSICDLAFHNHDLIITDLMMPKWDGDDAIALAKTFGNNSPFLIITGLENYTHPSIEVLHKPFTVADLKEKVKKLIKQD